jgi:tRNA-dihydrouridine synthase A
MMMLSRYEDLVAFTAAVRSAGVRHLIVHARKCLLKGLSPAANRLIPPLRYQVLLLLLLLLRTMITKKNHNNHNTHDDNDSHNNIRYKCHYHYNYGGGAGGDETVT